MMEQALFWRRAGTRAGLALGAAMGRGLSGPAETGQDGEPLVMDPMMAALVRFVRRLPERHGDIPRLRMEYEIGLRLTGLRSLAGIETKPLAIPGLPPAREYRPAGGTRGTMLFFHGGGFIMGSPATRDGLCGRLAATGLRVISAGYRLAPEHPFPAAHDDAAAALAWALAAREREAWPGPLIVGGDSAGANLAASLALDGRVAAQALVYPVVDMVQEPHLYPSIATFGEGFLLTMEGMEACAGALVPPGQDRAEPRLSPIRADLSRAAPALVVTAGFDPLRDQGRAFAAALRRAGRHAELLEEPSLVHGFADFAGVVPAARRAVDRVAAAVGALA